MLSCCKKKIPIVIDIFYNPLFKFISSLSNSLKSLGLRKTNTALSYLLNI